MIVTNETLMVLLARYAGFEPVQTALRTAYEAGRADAQATDSGTQGETALQRIAEDMREYARRSFAPGSDVREALFGFAYDIQEAMMEDPNA